MRAHKVVASTTSCDERSGAHNARDQPDRSLRPILLNVKADTRLEDDRSLPRKRRRTGEYNEDTHGDEGQVKLDVNRSFVGLLDHVMPEERQRRRDQLEEVIVTILRRHPSLHYFQGYHDIVGIMLLVVDDVDLTIECVERMSLHRLRDSMSTGLEPVIALLRLMKRILSVVDPAFARVVDQCVQGL